MAQWRWRRRFRGLVASLLRIAALHTGPFTPRMHSFFFFADHCANSRFAR